MCHICPFPRVYLSQGLGRWRDHHETVLEHFCLRGRIIQIKLVHFFVSSRMRGQVASFAIQLAMNSTLH